MLKTLMASIAGAVIALSVVLSCGDDGSPGNAAAATDGGSCDCSGTEPSLQGRIVQVSATQDFPANSGALDAASASCPDGAVLLSGGCRLDQAVGGLIFHEAGPNVPTSPGWVCVYSNPSSQPNKVIATAICLVPPPAS